MSITHPKSFDPHSIAPMDCKSTDSTATIENLCNDLNADEMEEVPDYGVKEIPISEATLMHNVTPDGRPYREITIFNSPNIRVQIFCGENVTDERLVDQIHKYVFDLEPEQGLLESEDLVQILFSDIQEYLEMSRDHTRR